MDVQSRTLILACGAMAREILALQEQLGKPADLQCLPSRYHNAPEKIVPALKTLLDQHAHNYDHILVGYGDCGTGGGLDRLLRNYPNASRLPGAHCYAIFSGLRTFDQFMDEEPGTFFVTDYLVRHFETLVIKGMGLNANPSLRDVYFKHYKRLLYISQVQDPMLRVLAERHAKRLGLSYAHKHVGYGGLAAAIAGIGLEPDFKSGVRILEHQNV